MKTSDLELFIMPGCPYCRKVLRFMERNGIELPLHDITTSADDHNRLARIGGKVQVPCLFIDGAPLYESADIVAYLDKRFCVRS